MAMLAVTTAYHAPSDVLPFFLLCAGLFVAFVVLVAAVAALANARDARRFGRADAYTDPDREFHPRDSLGGVSHRPWEELYQRRGYQPEAELEHAELASAERSAPSASIAGGQVAGGSTPMGPDGLSSPKHDEHL